MKCSNSNLDDDGSTVVSFHEQHYCVVPDLDHSWAGCHRETNFENPGDALSALNDGFVRVNDATEQPDAGESPTDDDTMGYYDDSDLPFYFSLATTCAVDDRYFSSALGVTISNRFYLMAATSSGHLDAVEIVAALEPPADPNQPPVSVPYAPITGTIFSLLDRLL